MEDKDLVEVVTLTDSEGKDVDFDHLLTFEFQGKTIVALMPMTPVAGVEEDEVMLLSLERDENGKEVFSPLESEEFLNDAFDRFLELFEEMEEEED